MSVYRIRSAHAAKVHRAVLRWYRQHQRELQWRTTRNPYHILVSEIMLQQTQVDRVKQKLPRFLRQFPTLSRLARATRADVVRAWRGMGYNNRAVRLRDLAVTVQNEHKGQIPRDPEQLRKLPGIGPYTAHALLCFAFGKRVPVVDVNIRRVLSRIFFPMKHSADLVSDRDIWDIAERVLPRDVYHWNQALMDLGATICTARTPACERCAVSRYCFSRTSVRLWKHHTGRKLMKREPAYAGIPHRIWRGRIVEALRNVNGQRMIRLEALGTEIKPDFRTSEVPWLRSLVDALVNDGIAETTTSGKTGTMVMLAE